MIHPFLSPTKRTRRASSQATIPADWPLEKPQPWQDRPADELDDDGPLELDDDQWEALIPDDDYESTPAPGDFWTEQDGI